MLCKIADLLVEIPEAGGMASRCRDYRAAEQGNADITLLAEEYAPRRWPGAPEESIAYLDSGWLFYLRLLNFDGMMLHASAVELDGKAYLFSGPSGMGKSTHTRLWQQTFGEAARVFNDDKPALRRLDGRWFAYGTPWCGKDGINVNTKVPLAGICFLRRGEENVIRRLSPAEAATGIISQTLNRFWVEKGLDLMLGLVNKLAAEIPVWELTGRPEPEAARLSCETMRRGAEEVL